MSPGYCCFSWHLGLLPRPQGCCPTNACELSSCARAGPAGLGQGPGGKGTESIWGGLAKDPLSTSLAARDHAEKASACARAHTQSSPALPPLEMRHLLCPCMCQGSSDRARLSSKD